MSWQNGARPAHIEYLEKAPPAGRLAGLGRLKAVDERDARFRAVAPRAGSSRRFRYWNPPPLQFDQGGTSECVAHAWTHYLGAGPLRQYPTWWNRRQDMTRFYKDLQDNDEWPGNNYDGTSVRAGARVLTRDGFLTGYVWARQIEEVIFHLLESGPMVFGTTWHMDMFTPDRKGIIRPTGGDVGGHAWLAIGINVDLGLVRVLNSWGRGWADQGRAWITIEDLAQLLDDYGEACMAREQMRAA